MSTGNRPPRDPPGARPPPPEPASGAAAPARARPAASFVVTAHPDPAIVGAVFGLTAGREAAVGRSAVADLRLDEASVSRKHARIVPEVAGWRILDLDSTNGTHVNGLRIRSTMLREGDSVRIGATVTLRFSASGAPAADGARPGAARAASDATMALTRVLARKPSSPEETLGRESTPRLRRDRRGGDE
jgi:pSer/pThr/pTyr-binding forkhead associated (FHA) protein